MSRSPVRTRDSRALFEIQLEPGSRGSRIGNLRDQLKAAIEDGRLAPGMRLPSEHKLALVSDVLHILLAHYTVVTLRQHVQMAPQTANVVAKAPHF